MDLLSEFLGSGARAKLLTHFVVHPDSRGHFRSLERHVGLGKRSLQTELERLEVMKLVQRQREGQRVLYTRNGSQPQWGAIESLVRTYAPGLVLRDALEGVPGLEAAFVFGSAIRGEARPDSDLDLFVYGNHISTVDLGAALLDAALVLNRPIDVKRYDRVRFRREVRPGASFLPAALSGAKQWLVGSPETLPESTREEAVRVPTAS